MAIVCDVCVCASTVEGDVGSLAKHGVYVVCEVAAGLVWAQQEYFSRMAAATDIIKPIRALLLCFSVFL